MFEIGASLREARTRRGLSGADVQKGIRIRERYLVALEEERWDMLPGEAYTKGFLRTYAEFLGLNGQLYIDEYNARIAAHEEEPLVPETMARRRPRAGILRTLVGILAVGALVAGLAAWRLAGTAKTPRVQAPDLAASAAAAAPAPPVAKETAPAKAAPRVAKPMVATHPVFGVIRATRGRCWLLVRAGGPNGAVLYRGVLEQGATKRFDVRTPVWVRLGRPLAVDVRVAGATVTGLPGAPANLLLSRAGSQSA